MYKMNLKNLYGTFLQNGNTPETFIANIIYERYGKDRKKMLQGLYNIINGGPKHFWAPCDVRFADWSMVTIIATPENSGRIKEIDIHNLKFYA